MNNKEGKFTLQFILTLGIFAIIFVSAFKVISVQKRVGKSSASEFEIIYLTDEIRNLLSDPTVCKINFDGLDPFQGNLDSIKKIKNGKITNAYYAYSSKSILYGQKDIAINAIYLDPDYNANIRSGSTTLNIDFEKRTSPVGSPDRIVKRKIKVYITLKNSKITSCKVNRGIKKVKGKQQLVTFWQQKENSKNIFFTQGNVSIGTKKKNQTLNLGKGLKLQRQEQLVECIKELSNSIQYNKKNKRLETCNGKTLKWEKLKGQPKGEQKGKVYNIFTSAKDKMKSLLTTKKQNYCKLSSKQKGQGKCELIRQKSGKWKLTAQTLNRKQTLLCEMICYK